jgi:hypothetical protein
MLISPACQNEALHLVSAPFGAPFLGRPKDAVVAQLVRAPVCGTGGRWFEPTQLYQQSPPARSSNASTAPWDFPQADEVVLLSQVAEEQPKTTRC